MQPTYEVTRGVHVFPAIVPVPGIGQLPVNAFFVEGREPYLVDTGLLPDRAEFIEALERLVDLDDLRWIFLTHDHPDHVGALMELLDRAPDVRVLTTFTAVAILGLWGVALPPERVRMFNPGERLDLGDRELVAMRPLLFDSPATTAVYDTKLDALFSSDSFGSPVRRVVALANDLPESELAQSQTLWGSFDSPWVHHVDRAWFGRELEELARRDPAWILSSHLPPARRLARVLCANLARLPDATPTAGPSHHEFLALMAGVMPATSPAAGAEPHPQ